MKSQKLLVIAAIVCLLVGASGTAMAVSCLGGIMEGTQETPLEVDEIVVAGRSCFVHNVIVLGDVTVNNSEDFTMLDSSIKGDVLVTQSGAVIIAGNTVGVVEGDIATNSNLVVRSNDRAWVLLNLITGSARVDFNSKADVKKNAVSFNLLCRENRRLDSIQNEVGGVEQCRLCIDLFDPFEFEIGPPEDAR